MEPIGAEHREELESVMDGLRVAIELDGPADYGDRVHGRQPNRNSFLAHFVELEAPLGEWDDTVERVQAAPGALWGWFARSSSKRGIREPPFAVGALIDRLAILTAERARHGRLGTQHKLYLQNFKDNSVDGGRLSVYVEGQNVAQVQYEPEATAEQRIAAIEGLIQTLFDDAQKSAPAAEIASTRDLLFDLKKPLLDRLTLYGSLDTIVGVEDCSVCGAERAHAADG
jgi:hypothetical protein